MWVDHEGLELSPFRKKKPAPYFTVIQEMKFKGLNDLQGIYTGAPRGFLSPLARGQEKKD